QDRELVRDLEAAHAEAVERGRTAAAPARLAAGACRGEGGAPEQHAAEVCRRDVAGERRAVEAPPPGDWGRPRRARGRPVRVGELPAQALAPREDDRLVVEREPREAVDRVPVRVARQRGVEVARDETEVRGRQLPAERAAVRVAARLELLEVRELAHVDLA